MSTAVFELSDLDGSNGFVIEGADANDWSGRVGLGGDVNGDGFDDVVLGAPVSDTWTGESYVVFGKAGDFVADLDLSTLDGSNGFTLNGINQNDWSGYSVGSGGDVNGDGFDDVIVGSYAGEAYVVFGKAGGFAANVNLSDLDGSNGFVLDGAGSSVSFAGDVNGDGFDDVIVGRDGADPGGKVDAGESYVVFGRAGDFAASLDLSTLDGGNGFTLNGINQDDRSGYSVGSAGDVNGDGFDDVIVGSYRDQSYVVFGKASGFAASLDLSDLDGSNGFVLDGAGHSVSSAGDVNGDGFDDVIVGSTSDQSYVVFGKASGFAASLDLSDLDGSNGFVLDGAGSSVSSAGDFDGDGFDDMIIGVKSYDNMIAGTSYLVFGRGDSFPASLDLTSLDGTSGFVLEGIDAGDRSGWPVSSAGDVNGDGFDDVMIGARAADPGGRSYAGESYVVLGGPCAGPVSHEGTDGGDSLTGSDLNDRMVGLAGDDTLKGAAGDDCLHGGPGADVLKGWNGSDWASYEGSSDGVNVSLRDRTANGGDAEGDVLGSIENLLGSDEADTLIGDSKANRLHGGDGADRLEGRNGDDRLHGGAGNDRLYGNGDADALDGGSGDDTLKGGNGDDALDGGAGRDKLVGGRGDDLLTGGLNADRFVFWGTIGDDTITDFEQGSDRIRICGSTFDDLEGFGDLEITKENGDSRIDLTASLENGVEAGTILVEGVTDLGADDFAFG